MKRIEYRNPEGIIRVAATNDDGTGLFIRGEHENTWTQLNAGLHGSFRDRAHFIRVLKSRKMLRSENDITFEYGWE